MHAALAERTVELRNGLTSRRNRRRLDSDRQPALFATHPQLPVVQVTGALISRSSRANLGT